MYENSRWRSATDHRANIAEAQQYLRTIANETGNIPRVFPNGIYGPETTQAVIQFQQLYGLPITGIIDYNTRNLLRDEYNRIELLNREPLPVYVFPSKDLVVGLNHRGDEVYLIQLMLNQIAKSYGNIPSVQVTGVYDNPTSNAVREFQNVASGNITGNVDKSTWDEMTKLHKTIRNA